MRWKPFTSNKYPSKESKEFKLGKDGVTHGFEYGCKYCGTGGKKLYTGFRWGNRKYYECDHIELVEYYNMEYLDRPQPWWHSREMIEITASILKQILYDVLQEIMHRALIDTILSLTRAYW